EGIVFQGLPEDVTMNSIQSETPVPNQTSCTIINQKRVGTVSVHVEKSGQEIWTVRSVLKV
ncbi:MAG: hypothetical protein LUE94_08490, partial [Clostridiales bacterium]|nr:hypothetical protein [Clostridiales bacterium]